MTSHDPRQFPAFYISPPHDCSYLPERQAVTLFLDPVASVNRQLYTRLAHYGFRRSGEHVYRPRCPGCEACVPARIPVADFRPNRSQRRNLAANRHLAARSQPFGFDAAQFALYRRYMRWRHPGSSMDDTSAEHYLACFQSRWGDTLALTFHDGHELVAVAITDRLDDGCSAVYTFFDPDRQQLGIGTHVLLRQIEAVRAAGLGYLYLGYWIAACDKMRYKTAYRPIELLLGARWRRLGAGEPTP